MKEVVSPGQNSRAHKQNVLSKMKNSTFGENTLIGSRQETERGCDQHE